jgi:hypothetical protein
MTVLLSYLPLSWFHRGNGGLTIGTGRDGDCLPAMNLMQRKKARRSSVVMCCARCNALFCVIVVSIGHVSVSTVAVPEAFFARSSAG